MITILLIILIILALGGGFYGYRGGYVTHNSPIGLIFLIIVILLLLGLILPFAGYHWYGPTY